MFFQELPSRPSVGWDWQGPIAGQLSPDYLPPGYESHYVGRFD